MHYIFEYVEEKMAQFYEVNKAMGLYDNKTFVIADNEGEAITICKRELGIESGNKIKSTEIHLTKINETEFTAAIENEIKKAIGTLQIKCAIDTLKEHNLINSNALPDEKYNCAIRLMQVIPSYPTDIRLEYISRVAAKVNGIDF